MKRLLLCFPILFLLLPTGCESLKKWDKDIKSRPSGVGIQGAAIVRGLVTVVKKYQATPEQEEAAKMEAAKVVAQLTPEQKEELKENPLIVVETVQDARADKTAKKSVVIFDITTEKIVGNNVYDIKPTASVKKGTIEENDLVKTEIDGLKVSYYDMGALYQ